MKYCDITDLSNLLDEKELRARLNRVSLPDELTDTDLRPLGYACVEPIAPPGGMMPDASNVFAMSAQYDAADDVYRRKMELVPVDAETAEFRLKKRSADVRRKRDSLLAECDWVVIRSLEAGEGITAWQTYRDLLRDIPNQPGFPYDVAFPTKPAE